MTGRRRLAKLHSSDVDDKRIVRTRTSVTTLTTDLRYYCFSHIFSCAVYIAFYHDDILGLVISGADRLSLPTIDGKFEFHERLFI